MADVRTTPGATVNENVTQAASLRYRADGRRLRLAALVGVLLMVGLTARPVRVCAENFGPGGGSRILAGDQVIGPYQVLATVSPEPAQVGVLTFAVRVSDPATAEKLRDLQVTVKLVHGESKAEVIGEATHKDAGTPIDYVAHIPIEQAGTYNGTLTVVGPAGQAEVTFVQRVAAPRSFSTVLLVGIPFAVVLAVLGGYWYLHAGARR